MLVDVAVTVICVKIFELGIISLAIGMTGTLLFVIFMAGTWLLKSFKQNLFGDIQRPLKSIAEIFSEGSAPAAGKFYSLFIVLILNGLLLKLYGVGGVAIFGAVQSAIRICRLHSQVTWQPVSPILTMEYADSNLNSMLLFLKITLQRAFVMAVLPVVVIFFGADYFAAQIDVDSSLLDFASGAFQAYSLSVVFAAINSVFIIAYSVLNRKIFANVLEFLRSLVLILLFLNLPPPKRRGFSCHILDKILNEEIVKFIGDWLALVKKFSDTGKNDFTAIHARIDADKLKITLRSTGKLFDYGADSQALELIQNLRGLQEADNR